MAAQAPIQIRIPPSLSHHRTPLSNNSPRICVGAFILYPPTTHFHTSHTASYTSSPSTIQPASQPHLLLLRPTSQKNWTIPTGSTEASDPTILHSVARVVFQATGLRLVRFVREVAMPESSYRADNSNHEDGESILQESRKSYFEIQVAEIPHRPSSLHNCDPNPSPTVTTSNTQKPHVPELSGFPKHPVPELATQHTNNLHPIHEQELQQIEITLDPEEYTAYTWATEEELASGSVGWGVEDGGGGGLGMKMSGSNGLGMREGVAVEDRDVCLGVLRGKGMVGVRGK